MPSGSDLLTPDELTAPTGLVVEAGLRNGRGDMDVIRRWFRDHDLSAMESVLESRGGHQGHLGLISSLPQLVQAAANGRLGGAHRGLRLRG